MCGKSIKKLVNKAIDLDPLRGGDVILEGMGLPNLTGEQTGFLGKADREKAAAEAAAGSGTTASTTAPTTSSDSVQAAVDAERRRRLAQSGQNGTILTGASGVLGGANTSNKTLLGV
ncbi:hypothetical protein HUW52_27365 [Pseudomonas sp. 43A]|uniref:hypothetical protein n=1 Tax=unclassified Pseudomonas TaxID=196821 RepID=UPI001587CCDE|nr:MULTISPECIES: hypothetical protein [unclassified Pseudomonas]QKV66477.1 hypothetical protein HUW52_27365 [Pseudomonas sp. 43A]QMW11070.1 hypothetical protein H3303_05340 [Pseudomonas sp. 29A]